MSAFGKGDNIKGRSLSSFSAFLGILLLASTIAPQAAFSVLTWAKTFGGSAQDDVFRSIAPASAGGYLIAGDTKSFGAGENDVWIIRIAEDGTVESQKTLGGNGGDSARAVKSTADGGHIVAGFSYSFAPSSGDFWLIKLDSNGDTEWEKTYGGTNTDLAHAVDQTSDGGYIIGGFTRSFGAANKDYFVVKVDASGNIEWQERFGGSDEDVIRYVKQASDGGYLVAGFTKSFGQNGDIWLLKLDAGGNILWQKTYGGSKFEEPSTILEVSDGYIILEQSASFSSSTDAWAFKIDTDGNILWQKTYGGTTFDELSTAVFTPDGGFIAAGETRSFGAVNEDFWVVKFDASANIEWEKRYGGSAVDEAESLALTTDGGAVIVGTTSSFGAQLLDVWAIRIDSSGNIVGCTSEVTAAGTSTSSTVGDSSAAPSNTGVEAATTTASVQETVATSEVTDATIRTQCGDIPSGNPPVASDDSYSTGEGISLVVPAPGVLANDSDPDGDGLTAALVSQPSNGVVSLSSDGGFNYSPNPNFNGGDSFTYRASDGTAESNTATVSITVTPASSSIATVNSITYFTEGGRGNSLHLRSVVEVVDTNGAPVPNAGVSIDLYLDSALYKSLTGVTGADGKVIFKISRAPSGCYNTIVTSVSAAGFNWDGNYPANEFCK